MATTEEFSALLKEYQDNEIVLNQVKKINWFMAKLKKDPNWGLGAYSLPVEASEASRFEWGALPASNDIPMGTYLKPQVSAPAELFGAIKWNNKDLERHTGDMKKSFLSLAPGKLRQFAERMDEKINMAALGDGSQAVCTANCTVGGLITVDRIGIFTAGEKIRIQNTVTDTLNVTGYVRNIDINAKTFSLYNAATGGAVVDASACTLAKVAKVYVVGATSERMTSLIDVCFTAAQGGKDTLYGGTLVKSAAPQFQPYFQDLSSATTGANLLSGIYDWYYDAEDLGRAGRNKEVLLPFNAFKAIAKVTEANRQAQADVVDLTYGAKSVTLTGPFGELKLTAARGLPKGYMICANFDEITLASRGSIIKNAAIQGEDFYRERATSGYTYICDKKFEAELITIPGKHSAAKIATSIT